MTPAQDTSSQRIHRELISDHALTVADTLAEAGYQGLLVGGCVRDLLLGVTPKDFDVATDATPEQVRELFRRCRLVGRRFRIAHVRFGRELIEVSTFRKAHDAEDVDEEDDRHRSEDGLILRDNAYGTLEEDAFRRDFTVNALYYDPHNDRLIDLTGGLEDLDARRLRFIGDTELRLREDPVRLLRAIRFKAKLGFELDEQIEANIPLAAEMLEAIPAARLFDEIQKLFMSGHGARSWELIADTPIRHALFPSTPPDDELVTLAMRNTDQRIAEDKPVTPGFLIAVLLWEEYLARIAELMADAKPADARLQAATETLTSQQQIIAIPRRFTQFVRDVWQLQSRLEARQAKAVKRLLDHARFRAAYDFLCLRADAGEPLYEQCEWWTRIQELDEDGQNAMIRSLQAEQPEPAAPSKRKRRRRGRRGAANGSDGGGNRADTGGRRPARRPKRPVEQG